MFENAFMEAASKLHPAVPVLLYVPLTVGLLGWGLYAGRTTVGASVLFVPLGLLTWILMEYSTHRYFFHWEGKGPLTRRVHEIAHGYHHKYPDDAQRLVMPLIVTVPLSSLIGGLLWLVGRPVQMLPYFVGIVWGYVAYDTLHWATHHRTPRTAWGKALRAHHMAHHFATPDRNFGISNRWVDILMGSGGRSSRHAGKEASVQEAPAREGSRESSGAKT
ncbi:sterol desaturase family protein [Corallococcus aberystwythensis]|uniref:Fatty acid hydroxylase n=1 Tax=Corallococcus aberystwythensis TaxID=2316722 RepID=A0A3A8QL62_9BACT|nr:sterol desaturase family protein [Corallococcus aberystwythensis]RKH67680.1 fatty acid hydroxylase [Corallococcus aberystwythensis]